MYRFFSPRLYLQGLKRLVPVTAICGILVTLLYVFDPITSQTVSLTTAGTYKPDDFICHTGGASLLLSLFFIPFIVFFAFSFLFKRNSSDFYHSLPQSRSCVLTSLFSACLTCIFAVIGFAICVKRIFPNVPEVSERVESYIRFEAGYLPLLLLHVCLWALALSAISLFSVCLAGRKGSAVILFFTCLIYPFLFVTMFSDLLISIVPSIGEANTLYELSNLFENGSFFSAFFFRSDLFREDSVTPAILAIAFVVLTVIAFIAYTHRKSETATTLLRGEMGRAALRIILCLPFITFAVFNILKFTLAPSSVRPTLVYSEAVLPFAVCILIWFIFELISKKQIYAALTSFKQLPILLALCLILSGSALIIRESVLSFSPSADEIESVTIDRYAEIQYIYIDSPNPYGYHGEHVSGCELSGNESKEILCSVLNSSAEMIRDRKVRYSPLSYVKLTFKLKNGRRVTRNLPTSLNDSPLMKVIAESSDEFAEKLLVFPEDDEYLGIQSYCIVYGCYEKGFDSSVVYRKLREEFALASKEEKLKAFFSNPFSVMPYVDIRDGKSGTYGIYTIPASFVNTRQALIDESFALEDCKAALNETTALINSVANGEVEITSFERLYITVTSNKTDILTLDLLSDVTRSEEEVTELLTLLYNDSSLHSYPDADTSYVSFDMQLKTSEGDNFYDNYSGIYAVSEETAQKIKELLSAHPTT